MHFDHKTSNKEMIMYSSDGSGQQTGGAETSWDFILREYTCIRQLLRLCMVALRLVAALRL